MEAFEFSIGKLIKDSSPMVRKIFAQLIYHNCRILFNMLCEILFLKDRINSIIGLTIKDTAN